MRFLPMWVMVKSGLYLGVDFGTKRIGLAVGQTLTQSARPLQTLTMHSQSIWPDFTRIVSEWQPKGIVIGLALQPDGSASKTSESAEQFGRHLNKRFQLPVYYIEERLTSVEAKEYLKENRNLAKLSDKDSLAAAIILESWLHSQAEEPQQDASP